MLILSTKYLPGHTEISVPSDGSVPNQGDAALTMVMTDGDDTRCSSLHSWVASGLTLRFLRRADIPPWQQETVPRPPVDARRHEMERDGVRLGRAAQNSMQFKTYKLFLSGIFYVIFSGEVGGGRVKLQEAQLQTRRADRIYMFTPVIILILSVEV